MWIRSQDERHLVKVRELSVCERSIQSQVEELWIRLHTNSDAIRVFGGLDDAGCLTDKKAPGVDLVFELEKEERQPISRCLSRRVKYEAVTKILQDFKGNAKLQKKQPIIIYSISAIGQVLGEYESENQALEVMNNIQRALLNNDKIFRMPTLEGVIVC